MLYNCVFMVSSVISYQYLCKLLFEQFVGLWVGKGDINSSVLCEKIDLIEIVWCKSDTTTSFEQFGEIL